MRSGLKGSIHLQAACQGQNKWCKRPGRRLVEVCICQWWRWYARAQQQPAEQGPHRAAHRLGGGSIHNGCCAMHRTACAYCLRQAGECVTACRLGAAVLLPAHRAQWPTKLPASPAKAQASSAAQQQARVLSSPCDPPTAGLAAQACARHRPAHNAAPRQGPTCTAGGQRRGSRGSP